MEIQEIHRDHYNELINDLKAIHTVRITLSLTS